MTVIVWKDGQMAADSQAATEYGCITGSIRKVMLLGNGKYQLGVSGTALAIGPLKAWVNGGCDGAPPSPVSGKSYSAILVQDHTHGWIIQDGGAERFDISQPLCIGSGAEIAYGALAMGATPIQAVQAAIDRSIYCGGEIHSV
ncbi:hypothetical protein K6L44_06520 [Gluconacetobacter entanii]|uniref:hypothetical protein n=1 Tax=Gluconacetobacter entanii TaxID=108528 RepID=UPI001C9343D6|nr:hypothetical protein [Gluconacetobacter entanii]MBY4639655.1 hypothetical protein [Gluconacetobacter entanii]MCW4579649.1 hypothetical protein [Gluconacetobacter entanii]MCW4583055.1 hypothetical protein [Gluconacetobacter entanii]MCW4586440.1 hypothetical protein [Gluconacetobacter entanii]